MTKPEPTPTPTPARAHFSLTIAGLLLLAPTVAADPGSVTLPGNLFNVFSVAISPKGDVVAAGSSSGTIKLWRPDGKELAEWRAHPFGVNALAFLQRGSVVASAGTDGAAKLWDVPSGREVARLSAHTGNVIDLVTTSAGDVLASCGQDCSVQLWDVEARKRLKEFSLPQEVQMRVGPFVRGRPHFAASLALSPTGTHLAAGTNDGTAYVWTLPAGEPVQPLSERKVGRGFVAFSGDGKMLAAVAYSRKDGGWAGQDGVVSRNAVRVVETFTQRTRIEFDQGADEFTSLAFAPNGRWLLAGVSGSGRLRVWDLMAQRARYVETGHKDRVNGLAFGLDGRVLVTGSRDGTVKVWEPERLLGLHP